MKTKLVLSQVTFTLCILVLIAICDLNPLFFWSEYREFIHTVLDKQPHVAYAVALFASVGAMSLYPWPPKKEVK